MMYTNHVHHLSEEITFQTVSPEFQSLLSCPSPGVASSHGIPYLTILNELPNTFRFRYLSDQGSHGGIHPVKVKLHNCDDPSNIHIKVSLYTNEDEPRLHTNFLFGNHCEDGVCWVKLSEDCTAEFPHLPIFIKKGYEIKDILKLRIREEYRQNGKIITEKDLEKVLKVESKSWDISSVKFCFEAFYCKDESSPVCEKIFSKPVKNVKNKKAVKLNICRLSRCSGKTSGQEDIILLCEEIDIDDTEIVFFSLDDDQNEDWKVNAKFNPNDVHYQVAIYFQTPAFKENTEKDVFIQLRRKSDGLKSNAVKFHYEPCHELEPELIVQQTKKREICYPYEDNLATSSTSSSRTEQVLGNFNGYCELKSPLSMSVLSTADRKEGQFSDGDKPSDELPDEQKKIFKLTTLFPEFLDFDEVFAEGLSSLNINDKTSAVVLNKTCSSETKKEQMLKNTVMKLIKRSRNDAFLKFLPTLTAFKDEDENNLLHLFIMEESENLSSLLKMLEYAPDDLINQVNKMHMTPLLTAVSKNLWRIVQILLKLGADPNIKDKKGNNCVHLAAKFNFPLCMREALASLLGDSKQKYIPDINGLNYDGLAPLHLSIIRDSEICTELLCQANATVNITDGKSGKTPLHFAYERSSKLVTLLLRQPEIDSDAKDYRGNIPRSCQLRTPNSSSPITPEPNEIAPKVLSKYSVENEILGCKDEKHRNNSQELPYDKKNHIHQYEDAFCKELDSNGLWKKFALYVIGEEEVSKIAIPDPTRTVLDKLKEHHGAKWKEQLKFILEDNELMQHAELLHLYHCLDQA